MTIPPPLSEELDTIPEFIGFLSNFLFPGVSLLLFAMFIAGGITRLTAAGDAEKEKESQKILTNAVIGTVIIILARVIMQALGALFNVKLF